MVNFNLDSTITKPPIEIVNLIIIEHWYNVTLAYEYYNKHKCNNAVISMAECSCRLTTLFLSVNKILERKLELEQYNKLKNICLLVNKSLSTKDFLEAYLIIHSVLDACNLLKIDTKPYVNRFNTEESNKAFGY
jgi:hypothetical protein